MSTNQVDELDYDPAFDELAFIHNLRRFMINIFYSAHLQLLQQPDDPRTQHAVNETEDLLRLFERAGLIDRLPESVRCNEANNLIELFGSEQRVSEIFRIKSAATRTWQDLNNAAVDDCIRQPFLGVSGLSMTKRHIVYRKHHGGVQATCQWSHLAHLALKGSHLHSKNEDGDWIHCPEIDDRSGVDLSHLCHVADCINKNHLFFEPWWINLARNCCRYAGYCLGDEVHPGVRPCIFTRTTMEIIRAGPNIPPVVTIPGNYDVPREKHDSPRPRRRNQEKTPAQQAYDTERRREAQRKSTRTFEDRSAANKKGWKTKKRNRRKKEKEEEKKRRQMGLSNFVDRSHHVMTTSSSSLNVEEAQPVGRCGC